MSPQISNQSLRLPALFSGSAILLLCFVGGYAGVNIESITKLPASQQDAGQLRFCLLAFFTSGVIDLFVAYGLFLFFKPFNYDLAVVSGIFRAGYVAVLLGNMPTLNMAANLVESHYGSNGENGGTNGGEKNDPTALLITSALQTVNLSFNGTSLALFGVHLFILGVICFTVSNDITVVDGSGSGLPKWLGFFLLVAGIGYTADSVDRMLEVKPSLNLTAQGAFLGEILLMGWLLAVGRKVVVSGKGEGLLAE